MSTNESLSSEPSREAIEEWIAAVRREIQEVAVRIEPLLAEQQALRQRESLLISLLNSFGSTGEDGQAADPIPPVTPIPVVAPGESVRDYVCNGVRTVLEEAAVPLHINDIHARFISRGLRVPGAGKPANLTAHLVGCERIVSPKRGFYALAIEGDPAASSPARRRRRRRRRSNAKKPS